MGTGDWPSGSPIGTSVQEAAAREGSGTQRITHAGEVVPPEDIARLLQLGQGEKTAVRRRVIYLDERAMKLTDSYYPASIAAGTPLAETRKIRGGAVALSAELGFVGRYVQEDVTAWSQTFHTPPDGKRPAP